ncbi:ATPase [Aureococcus anophagefferens]|nr:ATPase [Aureococcus anophagefferens]
MAYLHLRRAARHVAPRDASRCAPRVVGERRRSRRAPDDGDDYASRTRRACFAAVGACGFVVRHAKRQAYVLVRGADGLRAVGDGARPQSIFRRDAERRHCCGVSPANHLRVALAAGLSLVALVLVTLGRLSSFHALVGAYAGVAALLEGHAAMALLGCAVGLGFGALVVLRRGVLDYDDDGVDDDAAPRHLEVVERTLEVLGLEHIEGSVIGDAEKRGISGGQRKRVNVAMEIVSDPSLLFLDEPTSGLDSTTSFELVQSLRVLSGRKVNVVVVLHQPSFFIFRMFHDVLLLCRGGRTAYCGPSEGALPYFEASGFSMPAFENPADFFMDVIAGKAAVRDGASPFAGALADVAGAQDSRKGAAARGGARGALGAPRGRVPRHARGRAAPDDAGAAGARGAPVAVEPRAAWQRHVEVDAPMFDDSLPLVEFSPIAFGLMM